MAEPAPVYSDDLLNGPDVPVATPAPITVQDISSSLAPMTNEAAKESLRRYGPATSYVTPNKYPTPEQTFIAENQRPGIPLYTRTSQDPEKQEQPFIFTRDFGQTEVSPMLRYGVAKRSGVAEQLKYAQSVLGQDNVRVDKSGHDLIVTLPDKSPGAKPDAVKDVKLNEKEMTIGDFAALASHWPEAAGAMLGMALPEVAAPVWMARAGGLAKALTTIFAGATGQKTFEAAKEIGIRKEEGQAPEIGSTLIQKAEQIPGQMALDAATLGTFKLFNMAQKAIRAPLATWNTPVQLEGKVANEALATKLGVEPISYTPGEASGMPLAIFAEAYAKAKPQARAAWEAFTANQEAEKQAIGRAMTAMSGTDEQVGTDLIAVIQQTRANQDAALEAMRATMTKAESSTLDSLIGRSVKMPSAFKPSEAGAAARTGVQDLFAQVKADVGKAYSIPGMKTADIPAADLAANLDKIAKEAEGIPGLSGVLKHDLPEFTSFEQLKNGRAMARQNIEDSPAERTVKDYYAGKVDAAYTAKMEDAATNVRDPGFKKALGAANTLYRTKQLPFYQSGIGDILRKPGSPGSPENMEILNRFTGNTDLYRRLVDVTGKDSDPVKLVKQAIVDGVMTKSGTQAIGSTFVNGGSLAKNLQKLKTDPATREMFNDVFGKNGDAIINQARALGGVQGTIPRDEALAIMSGSKSVAAVVKAEDAIKREYTTTLMAKVKQGELTATAIDPQQLVNRFLEVATPSEARAVKGYIATHDPTLLPMVQDKIVQQILGKAGEWNRTSIEEVINNPKMKAKYMEFLGDKFDNVADFAKALGPIEAAGKMAQGTGMLVKGQAIGELARIFKLGGGIITKGVAAIPGWISWKLATQAILSGPVRAWAAKTTAEDIPHLVKAAVLSEPVLEDLLMNAGGNAQDYVISARRFLNSSGASATNQPVQRAVPQRPTNQPGVNSFDLLNAP